MTTLTLKVPEELAARVEKIALRRRVSKSRIVREALEEALHKDGRRSEPSAHDLMKHGFGIVKGGPRDLSTNKKYFAGFGR